MTDANSGDELPERTPRVWVAPSYFTTRGAPPDRYHTKRTCRSVTEDYVELDRDDVDGDLSECLYCAGEITSPDSRRTPLIDRVDRGEIETVTASKRWWKR